MESGVRMPLSPYLSLFMIVPACGGLDGEELEEMVREINVTQVAEEEVLSNHIYYYERRTGCLRMFDPAGKRKEGVQ